MYARGLGTMLYVEAVGTGRKPPSIPVGSDWRESLCRILRVDGPARRQAKRALDELHNAGLLLVRDGCVRVLWTADEVALGEQVGLTSVQERINSGSLMKVTPENDSTPTPLDQIEEIRSEERAARAREASPPEERSGPSPTRDARPGFPDDSSPKSIGHDFLVSLGLWNPGIRADLVEYIGLRPESERLRAHEVLERERRTDWFKRNGSVRHIVDWWDRAYGKGQTPNQRDDRPGLRSTAPTPKQSPLVERLDAQIAALRAQLRQTPPEEWEHTRLSNQIAELQTRVTRARYAA